MALEWAEGALGGFGSSVALRGVKLTLPGWAGVTSMAELAWRALIQRFDSTPVARIRIARQNSFAKRDALLPRSWALSAVVMALAPNPNSMLLSLSLQVKIHKWSILQ